jgi:hypothetical protein
MTPDAYTKLRELMDKSKKTQAIHVEELNDPDQDRTLLHGYTCDHYTFHVYLKDRQIHRVIYTLGRLIEHISGVELDVDRMAPDKRTYPEACDEQFCFLMHFKNQYVSYTNFDPERKPAQFHGKLLEELSPV